jgi:hypothetical protein
MHTHIPPFTFLLFILSLICSALSQGLTDAQINIVKQRLQEGATHRSASHRDIIYPVSLFRRENTLGIRPCGGIHHGRCPRLLNDGYDSTVFPSDDAKRPVLNSLLSLVGK